MTYSEKLRLPQWQKKRLHILQRDDWRCVICSESQRNLQVHHIVYARGRDPWDYPDHCYQTLCDECHVTRQQIIDSAVDALRLAIKDLPTPRLAIVSQRLQSAALEDLP